MLLGFEKLKRPRCPCQVHRKCIFWAIVPSFTNINLEYRVRRASRNQKNANQNLPSYRNKIHGCRSKLLIYRGDNSCTCKPHNWQLRAQAQLQASQLTTLLQLCSQFCPSPPPMFTFPSTSSHFSLTSLTKILFVWTIFILLMV